MKTGQIKTWGVGTVLLVMALHIIKDLPAGVVHIEQRTKKSRPSIMTAIFQK